MNQIPGSSHGRGLFRQVSIAFRRFCVAVLVLLGSTSLFGADLEVGVANLSNPSQATPAARSIAQLTAADALLKSGQLAAAKLQFSKVINLQGVPEHHIWEARQRMQEIERRE